ncbi:MAG: GNAT family N-acetyltransferase [Prevotella sp.]|nr:GNAT family N-acetyltransferase [Prevotella sp.]
MEIKLRALEPEDLELLYQIENQPELWRDGITNVPYSRHVLREFILNSTADIYRDGQVRLMVENAQGQVVGMADLVNFSPAHRRAELGLLILPDHRHRGYATATIDRLRSYASQTLYLHQMYSIVDSSNTRCAAMFASLGLKPQARLPQWLYDGHTYRDALMYVITLE